MDNWFVPGNPTAMPAHVSSRAKYDAAYRKHIQVAPYETPRKRGLSRLFLFLQKEFTGGNQRQHMHGRRFDLHAVARGFELCAANAPLPGNRPFGGGSRNLT
jgi:hypothetical protein